MSTLNDVKEKIEDEVGKKALKTVTDKVKKKVGNDKIVDTISDYVEDFLFDDDKKKTTKKTNTKKTSTKKTITNKTTKNNDSKLDDIIDIAKEFISKDK